MLGQTETARLLQQCEPGTTGMEEVLSSYVIWKYLKGRSTAHILGKLKTLTCFLRVTYVFSSTSHKPDGSDLRQRSTTYP